MSSETLYLKLEKNVRARHTQVTIGEIGEVLCSEKPVENRVRALRLPSGRIKGPGRYVFSVTDVIGAVQKEFPKLEICSLGEADFIITVESPNKLSDMAGWGKTVFVCLLAFFGAAFSIMAFNNDVGITRLFGQLYEILTGEASDGFTVLEISYSAGVGLGILLFFHHFARKKSVSDPTPLEVQMRTYEDEVDTTLIEAADRAPEGRGAEGDPEA